MGLEERSELRPLTELAGGAPTTEAWRALCTGLAALEEARVPAAVAALREPVRRWAAPLRRVDPRGPAAPWLAGLFAGRCDPRLELVGQAVVQGEVPFTRERERLAAWPDVREAYPLVVVLARALAPDFDPPDTLRSRDGEWISAAGCGGGFDQDVRGDETRGATWYDQLIEHAADESSIGAWTVYGLPEGCALKVGRHERGRGAYTLFAEGPCPAVLELALAWGALMRSEQGVDLELAGRALAEARVPWRT